MSIVLFLLAIAVAVCVVGSSALPKISKTFTGARIFHPAFPTFVTQPLNDDDITQVRQVKQALSSDSSSADLSGLPWKVFPGIGISDKPNAWSKSQIFDAYDRNRHRGHIVWAEKIEKPEKGCILLNHWNQKAVLLTDYDVERGAKGYEIRAQSGAVNFLSWPPLALELELTEDVTRWQPVRVSDNISSGEVFSGLPPMMSKAPWELIFLLLISPSENKSAMQALFDTGLCPKQGLIAYLRLLEQVLLRAEAWEGVPQYRKITENEIVI